MSVEVHQFCPATQKQIHLTLAEAKTHGVLVEGKPTDCSLAVCDKKNKITCLLHAERLETKKAK